MNRAGRHSTHSASNGTGASAGATEDSRPRSKSPRPARPFSTSWPHRNGSPDRFSATSGPDGYNGSSGCCIASRHTSTTDPYMKIALLTLPLNSNYGGVLQAFALKSHLTRLGHEVWLIDNRKRLKPVSNAFLKTVLRRAVESLFHPKEIFAEMNTLLTQDYKKSEIEKFIYRRLTPKTQPVFDAADYAELAASGNGFDLYIVGSDQVWRPRYAGDPEFYFFSFLEGSGARRISYAASFGAADCEYTREQRMRCGELLAGFEGVSVREDTAVGQCREYFGCDRAVHVLDPAMLLTADDYRALFTAGSAPSDTLYCYLFRVKPGARHILQDFAERHNLRIVRTTDRPNAARGKMPGIDEWLAGLHEARYVITDSFHACVFCILFHKPFAAYINRSRGSARIHSLLKQFGLESRILSSGLQEISMLDTPIDWEAVDRILERRRAESSAFLDAHLCPASDTVTAAEPDGRAATAKAPAGTGKRIPAAKAPLPEIV
ncbi:polysaccharide pyruvyl transferase family protein [uncultured Alistipes sp.]|uniref:polysaccharide pyruvyl transferase family protein n=1 Tax=uncultured Alistipes sp. TaxID=538949 RepID=UPI00349FE9DD